MVRREGFCEEQISAEILSGVPVKQNRMVHLEKLFEKILISINDVTRKLCANCNIFPQIEIIKFKKL